MAVSDDVGGTSGHNRRARRLPAEDRRKAVLKAARLAFSETGDVNGTTIKLIAEYGGTSEGVIYRHFESKEQLFFEAVVEPLEEAVEDLIRAAEVIDQYEPLTPERQMEGLSGLYAQLVSTLRQVVPLLGLVMFGDPQVARRFYKSNFAPAMDRLGDAWNAVEEHYGARLNSPPITARAVMGLSLILALESQHVRGFDLDAAIALAAEQSINGFFPPHTEPRRN